MRELFNKQDASSLTLLKGGYGMFQTENKTATVWVMLINMDSKQNCIWSEVLEQNLTTQITQKEVSC
jgi:hypothetical protein